MKRILHWCTNEVVASFCAVGQSFENSNMGFLLPEMGNQISQQAHSEETTSLVRQRNRCFSVRCGVCTHFSGITARAILSRISFNNIIHIKCFVFRLFLLVWIASQKIANCFCHAFLEYKRIFKDDERVISCFSLDDNL